MKYRFHVHYMKTHFLVCTSNLSGEFNTICAMVLVAMLLKTKVLFHSYITSRDIYFMRITYKRLLVGVYIMK